MKKRWFLDMCFIIYYASNSGFYLEEKVRKIVANKKEEYIICYYITEENLPKWIKEKKSLIYEAKQITSYTKSMPSIEDSQSFLFKRYVMQLKKILKAYAFSENKKDFFINRKRNITFLERKIRLFVKDFIDEKVIPIKEIDLKLRSSLFTYLDNVSDANTLASGIQEHNKNAIMLITSDKEHWTEDNLKWAIPPASDLEKKYPKLPRIKYLQDL